MANSEKHVFSRSGPMHLTKVDWKNPDHRRSVGASLVEGAYVLEDDRQKNRLGPDALAPPWWEFFHFELKETLSDDADFSIFGAIYELKSAAPYRIPTMPESPKCVIVFRGNILKLDTFSRDLKLDLDFLQNCLDQNSRFQKAMEAVHRSVVSATSTGNSNIWLAGHSLGAAYAMLIGKNMAKTGVYLEAFLFNPPFFSVPTERIKHEKAKRVIRTGARVFKAVLNVIVNCRDDRSESEELFAKLSPWVPCLFVNKADHIGSEYVGYFEHRKFMKAIGLGDIDRVATQTCIRDMCFGRESEPLHLLPSVNLAINRNPSPSFKQAHGILQWWSRDLDLKHVIPLRLTFHHHSFLFGNECDQNLCVFVFSYFSKCGLQAPIGIWREGISVLNKTLGPV